MTGIRALDIFVKVLVVVLIFAFMGAAFKFLILDNEILFPEESKKVNGGTTNTGTNNSDNVDTTPEGDSSGSTDGGGTNTPEGDQEIPPVEEPEDLPTDAAAFDFVAVDGGYEVNEYKGTALNVVIPSTYNGQPVVGIASFAFSLAEIESVVVPEGVKYIGDCAFLDCSNLTFVDLPESLLVIGNFAFSCCRSLQVIYIPSSVNNLGEMILGECENMVYIRVGWKRSDPRANIDFGCNATVQYFG